jgi:hypothetical protein
MTTRKPDFGAAAKLLLLGAMIAAAPVLAGCAGPNVDYSANVQCTADNAEFAQRLLMPNVPNSLMCLENVAAVNGELFNTTVIDAAGYRVGRFRRVEVKDPGDLVAVITLYGSGRTIAVLTDHVRYHPGTDVIITDLTTREIDLTPSGFPYG